MNMFDEDPQEECMNEAKKENKTINLPGCVRARIEQESEDKRIITLDDINNLRIAIYGSKTVDEFIATCWN